MDQVTMARVGYLIKRAQMVLHDAMAEALGNYQGWDVYHHDARPAC